MRTKFSSIEAIIRAQVNALWENLNKRKDQNASAFECEDERVEEDDEADMSTQFLQMQKNQLLDLQQHFEPYVNTLPVFGFNSGKYDLNLIRSYLLTYLIHERDIQPTVIKKANPFVSLKFGDVQFLDILNFLGGATSPDSFLKAYKTSETKGFVPYEWFDSPEKLDATFLPPYYCFFSKLRNYNPLEKDFTDFTKLLNSGFSQQESLKKLRLKNVLPSGIDNYNHLKVVWEQANICLHKSTNPNFLPFVEADKDLHDGPTEKYRRVMDEIINLTSTNRGFRTINHCVATYEQTKRGLSYFYLSALFNLTVFIQHHSTYN